MGEAAKRRRRSIIENQRCIYCPKLGDTIEHFPPRVMFLNKYRPDEMVFSACKGCNSKSRITDLAAAFVARCEKDASTNSIIFREWQKLANSLAINEPNFLKDLFSKEKRVWSLGPNGLLQTYTRCVADGPIFRRHMRIFGSKCGMALYRRHMDVPLPETGVVYSCYFLNEGMPQDALEKILNLFSESATLTQGKFSVESQFYYRYGMNKEEGIFAAAIAFHQGLQIITFALRKENFQEISEQYGFQKSTVGHIFD